MPPPVEWLHVRRDSGVSGGLFRDSTGQPFEKIERDTDRDYILSAAEAVEYGVIDRVVRRPSDRVLTGAA